MKQFLLTISLFLIITTQAQAESYKNRWCNDVTQTLQTYAHEALYQTTYEDEENLLVEGIELALSQVLPKFHFYFQATLLQARTVAPKIKDIQQRVIYLRKIIRYALDDFWGLDQYIWEVYSCIRCDLGNHSEYALSILKRSLNEGVNVKSDYLESMILNSYAAQSRYLLSQSRRSRSYNCVIERLEQALKVSNLNIKRNLIRQSISMLSRRTSFCE